MSFSYLRVRYFQRLLMCNHSRKFIKQNGLQKKCLEESDGDPNRPSSQFLMDNLWTQTLQLMEKSEQLVRVITRVCSQKLTGVFRTQSDHRIISKCCSFTSFDKRLHTKESCRPYEEKNLSDNRLKELECAGVSSCIGLGGRVSPPLWESSPCRTLRPSWARCHRPTKLRRWPMTEEGTYRHGLPLRKRPSVPRTTQFGRPSIRPLITRSLFTFVLLVACIAGVAESCSSRSTPKPRPASSPTLRPNVTFQTYACPPAYAAWFCLNGATCFTVKIQNTILYNCECAEGYMGPRCEFKDPEGSYLPDRKRVLETASIAGGACFAIVLVFSVLFGLYVFMHKDREKRRILENPYHDRRPLSDSCGSDYICTITPLHGNHPKQGNVPLNIEVPSPPRNFAQDLFIVGGIDAGCLCSCERKTLEGHHILCVNQSPKFVVRTNVPNRV